MLAPPHFPFAKNRIAILAGFFSLCISSALFAQIHTVGLLSVSQEKVQDGYTLIYPHNQGTVFLLNNCGQVVHRWEDTSFLPGNSARLMNDGSIFITKGKSDNGNVWIKGGGGGGKIEHRDWDNQLIWEYSYNDSLKRMHHDFTVLPNGNVILIAWEVKSFADLVEAGRDTSKLNDCKLWVDHLIEIKPEGKSGGEIVWEWHAWDHLIQDHDATKKNYGNVAAHPELIDLNYIHISGFSDWLHLNCVEYNPELDQILLSSPTLSEIWIIDHSTTKAEAAGHHGGKSGRGGDLLFRWGNPSVYRQGLIADASLGYQHDAHWMDIELKKTDPDCGAILIFSNHNAPGQSVVVKIRPDYDSVAHAFRMQDGKYLPEKADWIYEPSYPVILYSETSSSAQRLPNGNTFVCTGRSGYIFEVSPDGEIVWEYIVPLDNGSHVPQGYQIPPSGNITFRAKKYSGSFPGFAGRDLQPIGYIEDSPDTAFCISNTNQAVGSFAHLKLKYLPAAGKIKINGFLPKREYTICIVDMQGNLVSQETISNRSEFIPEIPEEENDLYTVCIFAEGTELFRLNLLR